MERRTPALRPLAAALALALAGIVAASAAEHGSRPVTNCDDSGAGSLRDAYSHAADNDVIDLTALDCSTITLTTGALTHSEFAKHLTLRGPGRDRLTIDGSHLDRVLVHNAFGQIRLFDLSIANGRYVGSGYGARGVGGCVMTYEDIYLRNVDMSGCSVFVADDGSARGGAIYGGGVVMTIDSTITGNAAESEHGNSDGGAISSAFAFLYSSTISGNTASADVSNYSRGGGVFTGSVATIAYSLISNNVADRGGGLFLAGYLNDMKIVDTTISGNHARGPGGGVFSGYYPVTIANSTITANTAVFDFGAGIYLSHGGVDLESSIVAGNSSGEGLQASDIGGNAAAPVNGANNLVVAATLALPPDTISAEPMLGPLQHNGGHTWTHALLPDSPAIDRGNNVLAVDADQRVGDPAMPGRIYERTFGAATDIGAFELGAGDIVFADGFEPALIVPAGTDDVVARAGPAARHVPSRRLR